MDEITATRRTRIERLPKRGAYDRATIEAILDEGLIAHVGFVVDGQPYVIPTLYARLGDRLYLHGSPASRMLRVLTGGVPVCVTVTLVDALVLARSAFHHSINYRSVVVLSTAVAVTDGAEQRAALEAISEQVIRGRWSDVREPTESELKATSVLRLTISEASAKVRTGPPVDDEADYALPCWAGELPLTLIPQAPIADPRLPASTPVPAYVRDYRRPQR